MLIDQDGTVISGTDPLLFNKSLAYSHLLKNQAMDNSDSFSWKDNGEEYQIVYFPLKFNHWFLVNQIPVQTYLKQANDIRGVCFFVGMATLFLISLFFTIWILKYAKPIQTLLIHMKQVEEGNLSIEPMKKNGIHELDTLSEQFYSTVIKLDASIKKLKESEEQKRKEELKTLQYQINPHFLYNSINSICWMAMMTNNIKVADSLVLLTKIIMPILKSPSLFWTVEEEITFVDHYIQMLTIRFGGALDYKMECEEALYHIEFPRFTLQPIIENCFAHGMISGDILHVRVTIRYDCETIYIKVQNTGNIIQTDILENLNDNLSQYIKNGEETSNIGLHNVNKRLYLLYHGKSKMRIESSEEQGTSVYIEFQAS